MCECVCVCVHRQWPIIITIIIIIIFNCVCASSRRPSASLEHQTFYDYDDYYYYYFCPNVANSKFSKLRFPFFGFFVCVCKVRSRSGGLGWFEGGKQRDTEKMLSRITSFHVNADSNVVAGVCQCNARRAQTHPHIRVYSYFMCPRHGRLTLYSSLGCILHSYTFIYIRTISVK